MLRLTFALIPPHMDQEKQLIEELHDRKSPLFHKFLTQQQWNDRFAPSADDEQAVVDWAQSQGLTITKRFPDRLLVDVEAPVGVIEKALNIKINSYTMGSQTYFANDRVPDLPASLTHTVQGILGLNSFFQMRPAIAGKGKPLPPRPDYVPGPVVGTPQTAHAPGSKEKLAEAMKLSEAKKAARASGGPQITDGGYDPTDIYSSEAYDFNALYNQGHCCNPNDVSGGSPPITSIAIASYGDLAFSDMAGFQAQYPYLAYLLTKIPVDGGYTCASGGDDNCLEVTLDTEYSTAMSNSFGSEYQTAHVFIYEGASFFDIADEYDQMKTDGNALVTSTSWGCEEEACFDNATMASLDSIFTSMVGEGWTLIAASGDQGASAGCGDETAVQFPSSDPNFVAAGGTYLVLDEGPIYVSETGWQGGTYSGACGQNNGGSTGGFSQYFGPPSYQSALGFGARSVPDIALNAAAGQNMYNAAFGGLFPVGGTSIVAPELAGFFAQENSYGVVIGDACGGSGTAACAPLGNANYDIYNEGLSPSVGAAHYPYYDITSGCNSNDVTAFYGLTYYCAGTGYDVVTGWGSANMLQLAWSMNNWNAGAYLGAPSISFGGPAINTWYNTDELVDWDIIDNVGSVGSVATGIAGYSQGWDSIPSDPYSEATPGTDNSFYSGPQHVNSTFGCTDLTGALCTGGPVSQGCHTVYVDSWNNMGTSSGIQSYGPICYDITPPTASASLSGTLNGSIYVSSVKVTLSATDSLSGVKAIYYQLDGGAVTTYSTPFTVSATGVHKVTYYSYDVAGNESTVHIANFTIESPTSTAIASSLNPVTYGDSVTFTATVGANFGGTPGGTVTFYEGTTSLGSATLSSGKASLAVSTALVVGADSIKAVYAGNTNDETSTSAVVTETVKASGTYTTDVASLNPWYYGGAVSFTATVHPDTAGTPAGTVTFKDGTTVLGTITLSGGKAVYTTSSLSVGTHSITASYSGSTDFLVSTSSTITETIKAATTTSTVVSSMNPSIFDESVTFTATLKSNTGAVPGGTVTFKDGTTTLTSAGLHSGVATYTTSALALGSHSITAVYAGTVDFTASTSPVLTQTVNKIPTTTALVSYFNPSTYGKSVEFAATVTSGEGTPAGTVTFKNGTTSLGTVTLSSGKATFSVATLPVGSDSITAEYNGSTDDAVSTSAVVTQKVNQATTATTVSSSLNPSTSGESVTFTADVTSAGGIPTGTVNFMDGTTKLGTGTLASGKATFTIKTLSTGSHSIQAVYVGSTDFITSKSPYLTQKVNP
jgi:predicted secreted protein